MRQNNFNYKAFMWWRLESALWDCAVKATGIWGQTIREALSLASLFYYQTSLMCFKLFVCRGCFRLGVALYLLSSALSQSPDEPVQGGNVCSGLKFQPVLFLGNRQEFSQAWLHLLSCCSQLCRKGQHRSAC